MINHLINFLVRLHLYGEHLSKKAVTIQKIADALLLIIGLILAVAVFLDTPNNRFSYELSIFLWFFVALFYFLCFLHNFVQAIHSARYGFLMFGIAMLLSAILYLVIATQFDIPHYLSIDYWIFTVLCCLIWMSFSLILDSKVSELVNGTISGLTTALTVIFNIMLLSIPHDAFWQELQLPINMIMAPFIFSSSISSILVSAQRYCLEKYPPNNDIHN